MQTIQKSAPGPVAAFGVAPIPYAVSLQEGRGALRVPYAGSKAGGQRGSSSPLRCRLASKHRGSTSEKLYAPYQLLQFLHPYIYFQEDWSVILAGAGVDHFGFFYLVFDAVAY